MQVLNRAIAEYRRDGARSVAVVDTVQNPANGRTSIEGTFTTEDKNAGVSATTRATSGGKRKYRRHPKVSLKVRIWRACPGLIGYSLTTMRLIGPHQHMCCSPIVCFNLDL